MKRRGAAAAVVVAVAVVARRLPVNLLACSVRRNKLNEMNPFVVVTLILLQ